MIVPGRYLHDISRSFICSGKAPTAHQASLLQTACDPLCHNIDLIKAGLTYREFAECCWPLPKKVEHSRYMMMAHGCGLADEYPCMAYAVDCAEWGYDGVFEENR